MKEDMQVAVKISINSFNDDSAIFERKLLNRIKIQSENYDSNGIVKMLNCFDFRDHSIIVFELLDINLNEWIKQSI